MNKMISRLVPVSHQELKLSYPHAEAGLCSLSRERVD
jgi:hypothetical protein